MTPLTLKRAVRVPDERPQAAEFVLRRRWHITGQVQGVGFRPFVHRLASRFKLTGWVRNDTTGVHVEAQGPGDRLEAFAEALERELPPLARVDGATCTDVASVGGEREFIIAPSRGDDAATAAVTVDSAVCPDCVRELLSLSDRRYGYALINCTNCGPRFSIIRHIPYDRPNTTMAGFRMCTECEAEYTDPADRRFHAQPIACHVCGPKVELVDSSGRVMPGNVIDGAVRMLTKGCIVAVKGIGGFHLAVRADDEDAVARLRRLKKRDSKPFALMCADVATAHQLVSLSPAAIAAMQSPACPIILAPRKRDCVLSMVGIAPGNHRLGVMLPYTPIHHLLFARGAPKVMVMTSANVSDEPLVIDNAEAVERIGHLCDAILWHDRPIERCVDDSVLIDVGDDTPLPIRRSRGYAPTAIRISDRRDLPAGLCVGGELKNTVAVVRQGEVICSQHLGDLTHPLAFEYFRKAIDDLCALFEVQPHWIAHDLHPLYLSTQYANQLAGLWRVPLIGVQHHHAHAAAILAETPGIDEVLAVVCDGVGYGDDGTIWGGELLRADRAGFTRLASLRPLRLPGGDAAAKDTRRCALGLLHQAYGDVFADLPITRRLIPDDAERAMLTGMIRRNVNCIESSAAGRVFDGVAALSGVCTHNHHEAQAGIALEAAAEGVRAESAPLFALAGDKNLRLIDLSPMTRAIVDGLQRNPNAAEAAAMLHEQLVWAWETAVMEQVKSTGLRTVALSGGVFCNQRLTQRLTARLQRHDLTVLRHRMVPPNDGGLCLGQAAVALAGMENKTA